MYKLIPAAFAVIALGAFLTLDFLGYRGRVVELAALQEATVVSDGHYEEGQGPSYVDHLLSKIGMAEGLPDPTIETAKIKRTILRDAPLNSYFATPSEDVLAGWERIDWNDSYHTGFGWPDGMNDPHYPEGNPDLAHEVAIYLKGKHSIYLRAEYSEPTQVLATRLKQAYWVVDTGRDLGRLLESRPRASYFWTNVKESSRGASISNGIDVEHFHKFEGVHFLTAKSSAARRDEKMRYIFASLAGGVVIKLRAHAPEAVIKEVLETIDIQSLNQMQTLPSPLIAEGLNDLVIDTPEAWLEAHGFGEGYEPPKAAHGTDVGHAKPKAHKAASHGNDKKAMPKVHKGGFANKNCASDGQGKNCKVIAKAH